MSNPSVAYLRMSGDGRLPEQPAACRPVNDNPWPLYSFVAFFSFLASFFSLAVLDGFFLLSLILSLDFDMAKAS
jgi:hypothetical protein